MSPAEKKSNRLPDSIFEITSGLQLLVNIPGYQERVRTTFIGHERGRYFLMRLPGASKHTGLYDHLYQGNLITVSFLHRGNIWGFKSKIQSYALRPHPLLFVDFPAKIERHSLRKESRIECFFPVQAALGGTQVPSMLLDISLGGCGLTFERQGALNAMAVGDTLQLECAIFGAKDGQKLPCQIRSIRHNGGRCEVGASFDVLAAPVRERIEEYVRSVTGLLNPPLAPATAEPATAS